MGNFGEYIRQGEPNKAEKAKVWKTAIGLKQGEAIPCLKQLPEQCFGIVLLRLGLLWSANNYLSNLDCAALRAMTGPEVKSAVMLFGKFTFLVKAIHEQQPFFNILKNRKMHVQFVDPVNDPVKAKTSRAPNVISHNKGHCISVI